MVLWSGWLLLLLMLVLGHDFEEGVIELVEIEVGMERYSIGSRLSLDWGGIGIVECCCCCGCCC